jgi:hypothetical protein
MCTSAHSDPEHMYSREKRAVLVMLVVLLMLLLMLLLEGFRLD